MSMKVMLLGDGESEPNPDQVSQLTIEVCNEDAIALFFHQLPVLGWEVSYSPSYWEVKFFRRKFTPYSLQLMHLANNCYILCLGKKEFSSLLVHNVETKSWWLIMLCEVHGKPLGVARLSCCLVSTSGFIAIVSFSLFFWFYWGWWVSKYGG